MELKEKQKEIRNIAIIAHVDHGKTTLTDALMRQTGAAKEGTSMDSNSLEQERGITIYAKNASITYKGTKINIVDTPGHADFGSEVERVLRSIDSVLLVVDAQEGPMPQTRFVLRKSLELGLKPIVVLNKIDKPAADPAQVEEKVLELFLELGASDEQADFAIVYAIGRDGIAKRALTEESNDLSPLLDTILEKVPAATPYAEGDALRAQVFNLGYDNFMGRLAIARIYNGAISSGEQVYIRNVGMEARKGKITKLFTFVGLERVEAQMAYAGDIVLLAGIGDVSIGETITDAAQTETLPAIAVDEPTIGLNFLVNNSPFAGREGKFLTSRQIRDRLERELEINVGLQVDFSQQASDIEAFRVYGRGEMHIAILLENMRREGYELQVSQPQVIIRETAGAKHEPFEEVTVDVPSIYQGIIIERLSQRGFVLQNIITQNIAHGDQVRSRGTASQDLASSVASEVEQKSHKVYSTGTVRIILEGPTRGLLGYRGQFVIDTKGEGIICSQVLGFRSHAGEVQKRKAGSMISMAIGKALGFSLWNLQDRGTLYIGPGTEVYEGMVIGNTAKGEEMSVNPTKGKQLSNVRASGSDEALDLVPPHPISIEIGLEIMADDEYLEITPKSVRLRKQYLTENDRSKARRGG